MHIFSGKKAGGNYLLFALLYILNDNSSGDDILIIMVPTMHRGDLNMFQGFVTLPTLQRKRR